MGSENIYIVIDKFKNYHIAHIEMSLYDIIDTYNVLHDHKEQEYIYIHIVRIYLQITKLYIIMM